MSGVGVADGTVDVRHHECVQDGTARGGQVVDDVDRLRRLGERQGVLGRPARSGRRRARSSSSPSRGRAPSGSGSGRGWHRIRLAALPRLRPDGGEEGVEGGVFDPPHPSGSTWWDWTSKMNSPGRLRSVSRPLRPAHSRSHASGRAAPARSRSCRSGPSGPGRSPRSRSRSRPRCGRTGAATSRTCAAIARSRGWRVHDRELRRGRRGRKVLVVRAREHVDRQVLAACPARRTAPASLSATIRVASSRSLGDLERSSHARVDAAEVGDDLAGPEALLLGHRQAPAQRPASPGRSPAARSRARRSRSRPAGRRSSHRRRAGRRCRSRPGRGRRRR